MALAERVNGFVKGRKTCPSKIVCPGQKGSLPRVRSTSRQWWTFSSGGCSRFQPPVHHPLPLALPLSYRLRRGVRNPLFMTHALLFVSAVKMTQPWSGGRAETTARVVLPGAPAPFTDRDVINTAFRDPTAAMGCSVYVKYGIFAVFFWGVVDGEKAVLTRFMRSLARSRASIRWNAPWPFDRGWRGRRPCGYMIGYERLLGAMTLSCCSRWPNSDAFFC